MIRLHAATLASVLLALPLVGCVEAPRPLGEQCDRNTDCDTPLVCRLARCRRECGNVRDCPIDSVCVPTQEGSGVCLLPEETSCTLASDCPDPLVCLDGHCGNECVGDRDCASGAVCAEVEGGRVCVDPAGSSCRFPSDCGPEQTCIDGRCVSECRADRDCREGAECVDGSCVPLPVPDAGTADAGTDARVVVTTCDMPADCWAPNVAAFGCDGDACTIDSCVEGFGDCNGDYADGCELDLRADVDNCGACGRGCGLGGSCAEASCDGLVDVAVSDYQACAVRGNGRILCGGENDETLGTGERRDAPNGDVALVAGIEDAVHVETGLYATCALHDTGEVSCWGQGPSGTLGDGSWSTRYAPRPVTGLTDAIALDLYDYHACAVRGGGEVVCWGSGSKGQLGDGTFENRNTPVTVTGITDAVDVSTGAGFSCAVHATGDVSCWGDNYHGRLGDGLMDHGFTCGVNDCSPTPVMVSGIVDAARVEAGQAHACVVHASGGVSCWGYGGLRLGQGAGASDAYEPVVVSGIGDAEQVEGDYADTCVRRASGAVTCFGGNAAGMLGVGVDTDVVTPTDMMGVTDATDVGMGYDEACVLSASAGMMCAGSNDYNLGPVDVGEEWYTPRAVGGFNR